ncbi:keratin, type I cytoskeletal 9-like [Phoenix dactylifera]|uniref:Keratin, type I cytoskeletal 9-like n=1 Tax=Phoenix dactylifera TaxID=42345 RepID=A0A8B9AB30_PHODC|nr:keratin, type I cytoskeletal 9-like [Phoenix dactylifera]
MDEVDATGRQWGSGGGRRWGSTGGDKEEDTSKGEGWSATEGKEAGGGKGEEMEAMKEGGAAVESGGCDLPSRSTPRMRGLSELGGGGDGTEAATGGAKHGGRAACERWWGSTAVRERKRKAATAMQRGWRWSGTGSGGSGARAIKDEQSKFMLPRENHN